MRKTLALSVFFALFVAAAAPAAAADFQGRLLDGHPFQATVFGPIGAEPGVVFFQRDEAQVLMLDGEQLVIQLYKRSIDDTHFVTGRTPAGDFYRVDLLDNPWFYARGNDPFFSPATPVSTGLSNPPVFMHGGRHGGGG